MNRWLARIPLVLALAARLVPAQIVSQIRVVSQAASYETTVAPNSLASIFGTGLAASIAFAKLDSSGQLPLELGGIVVEIDGAAASILYVSPTQINFVMPAGTAIGTAAVTVRPANANAGLNGSVPVASSAPGIFSLDATGKGPGAILNGVTFARGPFLIETPENSGGDKRTRLAIFATGLRYAANTVQAQARDSSGRAFDLTVEYAGPAPGFFGLDQVNVVLPPEADAAGTLTITIATQSGASNPVTLEVGSLPSSAIRLAGFSLPEAKLTGAADLNGTVSLNAPARIGGFSVTLRSDNAALRVPLVVTIPRGQVSAQFSLHADAVQSLQIATVTASAGNRELTASLELDSINAVSLSSLTLPAASIAGGAMVNGQVRLTGAAPSGGATIQLTSDNAAARPPSSVTIPFGQNSAPFSVSTSAVALPQTAKITGVYGNSAVSVLLTVEPPLQLTLSSASVRGGASLTGTVTLAVAAPAGGVSVTLKTSDATVQTPLFLAVPGGQISAPFTIQTRTVTAPLTVTITASTAGFSAPATLIVNPPSPPVLSDLTVTPATVKGGTPVTGMVVISDPAPVTGFAVQIRSSAFSAAQPVVPFLTIPAGQTTAVFTIQTNPVAALTRVTISATAGEVVKNVTLTVQ